MGVLLKLFVILTYKEMCFFTTGMGQVCEFKMYLVYNTVIKLEMFKRSRCTTGYAMPCMNKKFHYAYFIEKGCGRAYISISTT